MTPVGTPSYLLPDDGRVHLVGVGGAGMSALARLMLARGVPVSGTDAKESRRLVALRSLGAQVSIGHGLAVLDAQPALRVVVASTAIPANNPEITAARERDIPVWTRAQALNAVMQGTDPVAVAGTHGKTTTTSMVTVALQACGVDPSFAIGSELQSSGTNAHWGSGRHFVVEADESDGSFLLIEPLIGIITNVEADHLDHWSDYTAIEDAFVEFGRHVGEGTVIACADDPGARAVTERLRAEDIEVVTYGVAEDADVRIVDADAAARGWSFGVVADGVRVGRIDLQVPGRHNALNATAAVATALRLGLPFEQVAEGLSSFTGTARRFELRGDVGGVRVYDDYAHHPTEVEATLHAAREVAGGGRVIVVFQSHRYSRTAAFAREFGEALGLADEVVVLEVYSAGEQAIPGASGSVIAAAVPLAARCVAFEPSFARVPQVVAERVRPGDIVLTMGAGDVGLLAPEIVDVLRARS
jgi:UDP-N-acetylmuramate--alanine ligase